jgi:two-component system NtrC family response regulator
MANVLIVDDDADLCELLVTLAVHLGHSGDYATSLKQGLCMLREERYDVVFLDVVLPDGNGLDAIPEIHTLTNAPEIIIITGKGDVEGAELAITSGVWDYVSKPASSEQYLLHMRRVLQFRTEKNASNPKLAHHNIVGNSKPIMRCMDQAAKAAESLVGVLFLGETGTGKELFARAVHDNSDRRTGPFVVVDCAAIPATLVESTLFGHERGAFTSADKAKTGLVAEADGGTLFLDEVGELPLAMQKTFLRVIQEHTFRPVGGTEELQSDFRLVAATNRDLEALVQAGRFRQDLLYRLQGFVIELPSLRQRGDDLKRLAKYYLNKLAADFGIPPKEVSDDFINALYAYSWPGNVRELFNVLDQVFTSNVEASEFLPIHLPVRLRITAAQVSVHEAQKNRPVFRVIPGSGTKPRTSECSKKFVATVCDPVFQDDIPTLKDFREEFISKAEKSYLKNLLESVDGNMNKAAKYSGLSASRLYALLRKYGIKKKF